MLRLLSRRASAPPIAIPQINSRVSILADGARYGGRVDDLHDGCIVVAAPDAELVPDRPVILEWRDAAGVWQMPAEVRAQQVRPFPTTSLRPIGVSECISEGQVDSPTGGLRFSARVVESARIPGGTRIPVSTVQIAGDRIAFWTILPLGPGDHVELVARTPTGELIRAGLVVGELQAGTGTWLGRADCDAENPASPAISRLVELLMQASAA